MRPSPPVTEKICGVKDPCSTSRIRCSYARFLGFCGDDNLQKGGGTGLKLRED